MKPCWSIRRYYGSETGPLDIRSIAQFEYPFTPLTRKPTTIYTHPHLIIYNGGAKIDTLLDGYLGSPIEAYASFFSVHPMLGAMLKTTHEIYRAWVGATPSAAFVAGDRVSPTYSHEEQRAARRHARWLEKMEAMGDGIGTVCSEDLTPYDSWSTQTPRDRRRSDSGESSDEEIPGREEEEKRLSSEAVRRVDGWMEGVEISPEFMPDGWQTPPPRSSAGISSQ